MNASSLSPNAALRIGLAARALPDTDTGRLMKVLIEVLGLPLTEEKLGQVTVRTLTSAADGELGAVPLPAMKQALDYLWGKAEVLVDEALPEVVPLGPGEMPGSVRIAVASNGGERLDGHFGTCSRFLVYQVSPEEIRLVDVRRASEAGEDGDKNAARATLIGDCHLLFVVSIGGPAAAKVIKADVHPVKFPNGGEAREVIGETQSVLGTTPPPWLAKAMGQAAEERVRFEREESEA